MIGRDGSHSSLFVDIKESIWLIFQNIFPLQSRSSYMELGHILEYSLPPIDCST